MLLETNYLSYKTGSGRPGDVDPRQNNFAGIGTTGGGVPGDSFPDVSTGVLAQMQHLIAYSGERVARPLAQRTREKQDEIIELSLALHRPVRFSDLTNRWAKDRNYAKSIELGRNSTASPPRARRPARSVPALAGVLGERGVLDAGRARHRTGKGAAIARPPFPGALTPSASASADGTVLTDSGGTSATEDSGLPAPHPVAVAGLREASGVAWDSRRQCLYVVGDRGRSSRCGPRAK